MALVEAVVEPLKELAGPVVSDEYLFIIKYCLKRLFLGSFSFTKMKLDHFHLRRF
jgi:hypothetical protein